MGKVSISRGIKARGLSLCLWGPEWRCEEGSPKAGTVEVGIGAARKGIVFFLVENLSRV